MDCDLLKSARGLIEMYRNFPLPVILVDMRLHVCWNNYKTDEFYPHLAKDEGIRQAFAEIKMDELLECLARDGNYTVSGLFPLSDIRMSLSPVWENQTLAGMLCMILGDTELPDSKQIYLSGQTANSLSNGIRDSIDTIFSVMDIASLKAELMETDWVKNSFNRIASSSYRILRISNNVSEYAKYRSGNIHAPLKVIELIGFLKDTQATLNSLVEGMGVPVVFHWPCESEILLRLEPSSFESMIFNVIHNSLYYTRPGNKVDVYIECKEGNLVMRIADRGVGIPATVLPDVFTPYFSFNKSGVTFNSGVGLGLTLSKLIAESFGGAIGIDSTEWEGTEVTITLPLVSSLFDTPIPLKQEDLSLIHVGNRFSTIYVCLSDALLSPYLTDTPIP